jgi:CHAT domain-containing protein/Tfp pilus assembly protein PilF
MKSKTKIFTVVILFLITQINLISQNNTPNFNSIYTLSDTMKAEQYYSEGRVFLNKAKYDSSIITFQKAIEIYEKLLQQTDERKLWVKYIHAKNYIGYNLCYLGRYDESLKYLNEARTLCIDKLGENTLTAAQIYQATGIYYDYTEDLNKSLEMFQLALEIRKNLLGENHSDVADTYNSIGIIYSKRSNKEKALDYFLKSLEIKKNVFGEEHSSVAASYNNIGINYFDRGDYGKALEFYQKSLSIRLKQIGEQHHLTASSYNNIGNCYQNMSEYDKAEKNHLKSLSIRKNVLGDKHDLVATSYNNLGLVYWKKEELNKAFEYFNLALDLREEIFKQNHPSIAQSYMNIGLIYYDNKEYDIAIVKYNKSLEVWKNLGESKRTDISKIYQNLSESYLRKEKYDSALIAIQKSIIESVLDFDNVHINANPSLNFVQSEVQLLNSLKIKSKIFIEISKENITTKEKQKENLLRSLYTISLADTLIDKMIKGFKNEDSKYFLGEKTSSIYQQAIETALRLHKLTGNLIYKEKAFYFIEKSKAAVLQQGILESKARQFANISIETLEKEKNLKDDLLFYNSQVQIELKKKNKQDSLKLYDYQKKLFELNIQHENLISEIENKYPSYYNLKYQQRITGIDDIQKELSDNSVLINYFVGDSIIYAAVISETEFDILQINKPINFNKLVRDFYASILKSEHEKYISSSNKLSELLINPVLKNIKTKKQLAIIPHDVLFKVPFEALFTKPQKVKAKDYTKLNYLVKDFDISYHYSAALLINSLSGKNKTDNYQISTKNFIGFAPVFPKDNSYGYMITNNTSSLLAANDEVVRSVSVDEKNFGELKYSEWEVNSIIDLFNKNNLNQINTAYFYSDAKEDSFKTNVNDYKIIHIASHSFMNEEQPDISGVVFAQPTDSVFSNDGILYSGETYNLGLAADLVVLSSCESGLGKLFRGEGMMALNRGFLYSGASNIVFSLWKIPDKHTSELMVEFYSQMISDKSYSESLRQAKLKLINDQLTARPRSWAGFLMIGLIND